MRPTVRSLTAKPPFRKLNQIGQRPQVGLPFLSPSIARRISGLQRTFPRVRLGRRDLGRSPLRPSSLRRFRQR